MSTPADYPTGFTSEELEAVRAFRHAAGQVHPLYLKYRSETLTVRMFRRNAPNEADLIPQADFESMARCLRPVYLSDRKARL